MTKFAVFNYYHNKHDIDDIKKCIININDIISAKEVVLEQDNGDECIYAVLVTLKSYSTNTSSQIYLAEDISNVIKAIDVSQVG